MFEAIAFVVGVLAGGFGGYKWGRKAEKKAQVALAESKARAARVLDAIKGR